MFYVYGKKQHKKLAVSKLSASDIRKGTRTDSKNANFCLKFRWSQFSTLNNTPSFYEVKCTCVYL